jgi:biotin carboxyl carrier protein
MAKKKDDNKKEMPSLEILNVDNVEYKTTLTKKFRNREKYKPVDPKKITAFIPGTIVGILTKKGKKVTTDDKLLELEAMKMVNIVTASIDGKIKKIHVKKGELVTKNQLLIELE